MAETILVVDDDPTVSDVVRRYLERAGYSVTLAGDGRDALAAYERVRPDLVVLDLMLPGIDGLEVCRRLRSTPAGVPIVMLTALGEEADRVLGLQLGADDYVTKPFSPRELVLRVQSVLRRSLARPAPPPETLTHGRLSVDVARRIARLDGAVLAVTVLRFSLLVSLLGPTGPAFRGAVVLEAAWVSTYAEHATATGPVRRPGEEV